MKAFAPLTPPVKKTSVKSFLRIVAGFLAACFLFQDLAMAAGDRHVSVPLTLSLPKTIGIVRSGQTGEDRTVINIQDAHGSLSAQKGIAKVLETLVRDYDVRLAGIEGSTGEIDVTPVSAFPSDSVRKDVAESLLAETKISAAEFFKIVSGNELELYGVEDDALFRSNSQALAKLLAAGAGIRELLAAVDDAITRYRGEFFDARILRFYDASDAYERGDMPFAGYWGALSEFLGEAAVDVAAYPNLDKIVLTASLEKEIDFDQAARDREEIVRRLRDRLDAAFFKSVVREALEFKLGRATPGRFHSFLAAEAARAGLRPGDFPAFSGYVRYVSLFDQVDLVAVHAESRAVEGKILAKILKPGIQEQLGRLIRMQKVLSGLLRSEAPREDVEFYFQERQAYLPVMEGLFQDFALQTDIRMPVPDWQELGRHLQTADSFYTGARAREEAMVSTLLKRMKEKNRRVAAIVTGGFHSDGLRTLFDRRSVSQIVILPNFEKGQERPYAAIVTEKGSFIDASLRREAQEEAIALTLGLAVLDGMKLEDAKKTYLESYGKVYKAERGATRSVPPANTGASYIGIGEEFPVNARAKATTSIWSGSPSDAVAFVSGIELIVKRGRREVELATPNGPRRVTAKSDRSPAAIVPIQAPAGLSREDMGVAFDDLIQTKGKDPDRRRLERSVETPMEDRLRTVSPTASWETETDVTAENPAVAAARLASASVEAIILPEIPAGAEKKGIHVGPSMVLETLAMAAYERLRFRIYIVKNGQKTDARDALDLVGIHLPNGEEVTVVVEAADAPQESLAAAAGLFARLLADYSTLEMVEAAERLRTIEELQSVGQSEDGSAHNIFVQRIVIQRHIRMEQMASYLEALDRLAPAFAGARLTTNPPMPVMTREEMPAQVEPETNTPESITGTASAVAVWNARNPELPQIGPRLMDLAAFYVVWAGPALREFDYRGFKQDFGTPDGYVGLESRLREGIAAQIQKHKKPTAGARLAQALRYLLIPVVLFQAFFGTFLSSTVAKDRPTAAFRQGASPFSAAREIIRGVDTRVSKANIKEEKIAAALAVIGDRNADPPAAVEAYRTLAASRNTRGVKQALEHLKYTVRKKESGDAAKDVKIKAPLSTSGFDLSQISMEAALSAVIQTGSAAYRTWGINRNVDHSSIRVAAANYLASLSDVQGIDAAGMVDRLARSLENDADPAAQVAYLDALYWLGRDRDAWGKNRWSPRKDSHAFTQVMELATNSQDPILRFMAIRALSAARDQRAEDANAAVLGSYANIALSPADAYPIAMAAVNLQEGTLSSDASMDALFRVWANLCRLDAGVPETLLFARETVSASLKTAASKNPSLRRTLLGGLAALIRGSHPSVALPKPLVARFAEPLYREISGGTTAVPSASTEEMAREWGGGVDFMEKVLHENADPLERAKAVKRIAAQKDRHALDVLTAHLTETETNLDLRRDILLSFAGFDLDTLFETDAEAKRTFTDKIGLMAAETGLRQDVRLGAVGVLERLASDESAKHLATLLGDPLVPVAENAARILQSERMNVSWLGHAEPVLFGQIAAGFKHATPEEAKRMKILWAHATAIFGRVAKGPGGEQALSRLHGRIDSELAAGNLPAAISLAGFGASVAGLHRFAGTPVTIGKVEWMEAFRAQYAQTAKKLRDQYPDIWKTCLAKAEGGNPFLLIEYFLDPNAKVERRVLAAQAMAEIDHPVIAHFLMSRLETERNPAVLEALAHASLAQTGSMGFLVRQEDLADRIAKVAARWSGNPRLEPAAQTLLATVDQQNFTTNVDGFSGVTLVPAPDPTAMFVRPPDYFATWTHQDPALALVEAMRGLTVESWAKEASNRLGAAAAVIRKEAETLRATGIFPAVTRKSAEERAFLYLVLAEHFDEPAIQKYFIESLGRERHPRVLSVILHSLARLKADDSVRFDETWAHPAWESTAKLLAETKKGRVDLVLAMELYPFLGETLHPEAARALTAVLNDDSKKLDEKQAALEGLRRYLQAKPDASLYASLLHFLRKPENVKPYVPFVSAPYVSEAAYALAGDVLKTHPNDPHLKAAVLAEWEDSRAKDESRFHLLTATPLAGKNVAAQMFFYWSPFLVAAGAFGLLGWIIYRKHRRNRPATTDTVPVIRRRNRSSGAPVDGGSGNNAAARLAASPELDKLDASLEDWAQAHAYDRAFGNRRAEMVLELMVSFFSRWSHFRLQDLPEDLQKDWIDAQKKEFKRLIEYGEEVLDLLDAEKERFPSQGEKRGRMDYHARRVERIQLFFTDLSRILDAAGETHNYYDYRPAKHIRKLLGFERQHDEALEDLAHLLPELYKVANLIIRDTHALREGESFEARSINEILAFDKKIMNDVPNNEVSYGNYRRRILTRIGPYLVAGIFILLTLFVNPYIGLWPLLKGVIGSLVIGYGFSTAVHRFFQFHPVRRQREGLLANRQALLANMNVSKEGIRPSNPNGRFLDAIDYTDRQAKLDDKTNLYIFVAGPHVEKAKKVATRNGILQRSNAARIFLPDRYGIPGGIIAMVEAHRHVDSYDMTLRRLFWNYMQDPAVFEANRTFLETFLPDGAVPSGVTADDLIFSEESGLAGVSEMPLRNLHVNVIALGGPENDILGALPVNAPSLVSGESVSRLDLSILEGAILSRKAVKQGHPGSWFKIDSNKTRLGPLDVTIPHHGMTMVVAHSSLSDVKRVGSMAVFREPGTPEVIGLVKRGGANGLKLMKEMHPNRDFGPQTAEQDATEVYAGISGGVPDDGLQRTLKTLQVFLDEGMKREPEAWRNAFAALRATAGLSYERIILSSLVLKDHKTHSHIGLLKRVISTAMTSIGLNDLDGLSQAIQRHGLDPNIGEIFAAQAGKRVETAKIQRNVFAFLDALNDALDENFNGDGLPLTTRKAYRVIFTDRGVNEFRAELASRGIHVAGQAENVLQVDFQAAARLAGAVRWAAVLFIAFLANLLFSVSARAQSPIGTSDIPEARAVMLVTDMKDLRPGATGHAVWRMKHAFASIGYPVNYYQPADGEPYDMKKIAAEKYDAQMLAQVIAFQKKEFVEKDGLSAAHAKGFAGPLTRARVQEYLDLQAGAPAVPDDAPVSSVVKNAAVWELNQSYPGMTKFRLNLRVIGYHVEMHADTERNTLYDETLGVTVEAFKRAFGIYPVDARITVETRDTLARKAAEAPGSPALLSETVPEPATPLLVGDSHGWKANAAGIARKTSFAEFGNTPLSVYLQKRAEREEFWRGIMAILYPSAGGSDREALVDRFVFFDYVVQLAENRDGLKNSYATGDHQNDPETAIDDFRLALRGKANRYKEIIRSFETEIGEDSRKLARLNSRSAGDIQKAHAILAGNRTLQQVAFVLEFHSKLVKRFGEDFPRDSAAFAAFLTETYNTAYASSIANGDFSDPNRGLAIDKRTEAIYRQAETLHRAVGEYAASKKSGSKSAPDEMNRRFALVQSRLDEIERAFGHLVRASRQLRNAHFSEGGSVSLAQKHLLQASRTAQEMREKGLTEEADLLDEAVGTLKTAATYLISRPQAEKKRVAKSAATAVRKDAAALVRKPAGRLTFLQTINPLRFFEKRTASRDGKTVQKNAARAVKDKKTRKVAQDRVPKPKKRQASAAPLERGIGLFAQVDIGTLQWQAVETGARLAEQTLPVKKAPLVVRTLWPVYSISHHAVTFVIMLGHLTVWVVNPAWWRKTFGGSGDAVPSFPPANALPDPPPTFVGYATSQGQSGFRLVLPAQMTLQVRDPNQTFAPHEPVAYAAAQALGVPSNPAVVTTHDSQAGILHFMRPAKEGRVVVSVEKPSRFRVNSVVPETFIRDISVEGLPEGWQAYEKGQTFTVSVRPLLETRLPADAPKAGARLVMIVLDNGNEITLRAGGGDFVIANFGDGTHDSIMIRGPVPVTYKDVKGEARKKPFGFSSGDIQFNLPGAASPLIITQRSPKNVTLHLPKNVRQAGSVRKADADAMREEYVVPTPKAAAVAQTPESAKKTDAFSVSLAAGERALVFNGDRIGSVDFIGLFDPAFVLTPTAKIKVSGEDVSSLTRGDIRTVIFKNHPVTVSYDGATVEARVPAGLMVKKDGAGARLAASGGTAVLRPRVESSSASVPPVRHERSSEEASSARGTESARAESTAVVLSVRGRTGEDIKRDLGGIAKIAVRYPGKTFDVKIVFSNNIPVWFRRDEMAAYPFAVAPVISDGLPLTEVFARETRGASAAILIDRNLTFADLSGVFHRTLAESGRAAFRESLPQRSQNLAEEGGTAQLSETLPDVSVEALLNGLELPRLDLEMLRALEAIRPVAGYEDVRPSAQVQELKARSGWTETLAPGQIARIAITETALENEAVPLEIQQRLLAARGVKTRTTLVVNGDPEAAIARLQTKDLLPAGFSDVIRIDGKVRAVDLYEALGEGSPEQTLLIGRGEIDFSPESVTSREIIRKKLTAVEVVGSLPTAWILFQAIRRGEQGFLRLFVPRPFDVNAVVDAVKNAKKAVEEAV